jgi:hypothetical protein
MKVTAYGLALFAIILCVAVLACDSVGYVTGGTVRECGSFDDEAVQWIDLALELIVCPKLEKHFEEAKRPCSANSLRDVLHKIEIYNYATGEDFCVYFDPPEK